MARYITYGMHRSLDLAERHQRQLEKQFPGATVDIIARRNSRGQFSYWGHYFVFEINTKELPPKEIDLGEEEY